MPCEGSFPSRTSHGAFQCQTGLVDILFAFVVVVWGWVGDGMGVAIDHELQGQIICRVSGFTTPGNT